MSRNSSIGKVTGYELENWDTIPGKGKRVPCSDRRWNPNIFVYSNILHYFLGSKAVEE
jgi:hypothetical protein